MATIDIALPASVTKALTPPKCVDLRLPKPGIPQLRLPTGGTIKGIADITKGIPNDCSMNFNIALQLAPIMASMECLLKLLKFVGIVVELLKNMTNPLAVVSGIPKIIEAAKELAPCIALPTPIVMVPFVKDLLLMLAKMLRCAVGALKSAVETLDGLELDLANAEQNGNDGLLQQLECAKENASLALDGTMVALEPVMVLIDLAKPFLSIANQSISIGPFASDGSLDSLKALLEGIETAATTLQSIAEAIPV
jgi:hypothetical protein